MDFHFTSAIDPFLPSPFVLPTVPPSGIAGIEDIEFFEFHDIDFPHFPRLLVDVDRAIDDTDGTIFDGSIGAAFLDFLVINTFTDAPAGHPEQDEANEFLDLLGISGFSLISPLYAGGSVSGGFDPASFEGGFTGPRPLEAIPIPPALPLFVSGLFGMYFVSRRRRRLAEAA